MAINGVNGYDYNTALYGTAQSVAETTAKEAAVTEETKKESTFTDIVDGFKTQNYKPDTDKINAMKAELKNNLGAFNSMVQGLFNNQVDIFQQASGLKNFFQNLTVDEETRTAAQKAISEDGEWGVNKTAERILDFAKALSGGDPAKIETLKAAVEKGFKAAESAWGGKLPDISRQTYDKVMEGFDEWAQSASQTSAAAQNAIL